MSDLISKLSDQTDVMSSPSQIRDSESYKAILSKGEDAIPELLDALRNDQAVIASMLLLQDITGENPIDKTTVGFTKLMVASWLKWGESKSKGTPT